MIELTTPVHQVSLLYMGYFDRLPDPLGLAFYVREREDGFSLSDLADRFAVSDEALGRYPFLRGEESADDFLNNIYENFFGRHPDEEGLNFWRDRLQEAEAADIPPGQLILDIAMGASGADKAYLEGRLGNLVEQALTTDSGQVILGSDADETLTGTDGNDFIDAVAGDNIVMGLGGNDLMKSGQGSDIFRFNLSSSYDLNLERNENHADLPTDNVIRQGGNDPDTLRGGLGNDLLTGGNNDDILITYGGNNTLEGGNGDDYLVGGTGNDILRGGNGNDVLIARGGDNTLDGGTGNDILVSGTGNDTLRGGVNADTFVMGRNSGDDTILDFDVSQDVIALPWETDLSDRDPFAYIELEETEAGTLVLHSGGSVLLHNVRIDDLHEDNFRISDGGFGSDMILDFTQGQDRIELDAPYYFDFDDINVMPHEGGQGVTLETDYGNIEVQGVSAITPLEDYVTIV